MHLQDSQEAGGFREPKMGIQKEFLDHWSKKYLFPVLPFPDISFWTSKATEEWGQGLHRIQIRTEFTSYFESHFLDQEW